MDPWERYAYILVDTEAFRQACRRPLPTAVRVNTIKIDPQRVIDALGEDDVAVERRGHDPRTLILDTDNPGRTWAYQHGWMHGQEEISQLPPRVLDPDPGDRVLEMAAAPGGKATQLAALAEDGIVLANDVNLGRLAALRSNADRLGVANMVVTNQDGRNLSPPLEELETFDGVLVDAPCSGEGTLRKNPDALENWSESAVESLAALQTGMLRRAVELTRPGGSIVYATCTFAPEENEGVLARVLTGNQTVSIVDFETPYDSEPGVTAWNGERYPDVLERAKRFYPHRNDTGGFFCAKLEVEA